MHYRRIRWGIGLVAALYGSMLLIFFAVGCGGGEKATFKDIDEVWARVKEADHEIKSLHMENSIYYMNTVYGSGPVEGIIIDYNGTDFHEKRLLFDKVVYYELVRIGDKIYEKDVSKGTCVESQATPAGDKADEYISTFLELPSVADSSEHKGTEMIGGRRTEHYFLTLSPQDIMDLFASQLLGGQQSYDYSENTGGSWDVWIDSENYYLIRCEINIRNVFIPEKIGKGDIRCVLNISRINEPISITPPI
jgi:hypothetical protein